MAATRRLAALVLVALLLAACQQAGAPSVQAPDPSTTVPIAALTTAPSPMTVAPAPAASPSPDASASKTGAMITKLVDLSSQALAGNLLGDPNTRKLVVLLPPDYDASTERYPVVYVLHGWGGDEYDLFVPFRTTFDKARKAGEVWDMIFVFIDGSNKLGGSFYLDSPSTGGYETYITREIVDYIDANYRTLAEPASRGITGCSMGGDGAAHLGMAHPDIFGVVASVSGGYHWGEPGWTELGEGYKKATSINDFKVLPMFVKIGLSLAAAAAPNPNNPPFYADEPWTIVDGKVQAEPDVVAKLDARDPMDDAKRYAEHPLRLNAFMVYHGKQDPMNSIEIARAFAKELSDLAIPHDLVEVDDSHHCGIDYAPVVKYMSEHLAFQAP